MRDINAQCSNWVSRVTKEKLIANKVWDTKWGFMIDEYNKLQEDLTRPRTSDGPREEDFAYKEEKFRAEQRPKPSKSDYLKYPQTSAGAVGYWCGKRNHVLDTFGPYCKHKRSIYTTLQMPEGSES
jgi:hypothetical protein